MRKAKYEIKRHGSFYRALAMLLCLSTIMGIISTGAGKVTVNATDGEGADSGTVTVTVNYVYESNNSFVTQPYRAQIEKGSAFQKTLEVPTILNYNIPTNKAEGLDTGITLSKNDTTNDYSLAFDLENVTEDITVTLYYVAGTAKYKVYHHYQNLNDDDYAEPQDYIELSGDIDAYTDAVAEIVLGYRSKNPVQQIIAADGTTEIHIYYDRVYYTIVFDVNGGVNGPEPIYAKYGTHIDVESVATPARAGYKFAGWSPVISETIEKDVTYVAQWIPESGQADYTIVIWGQNANDNEYSYISSNEAWGDVGKEVTWDADHAISHVHTDDCYATCTKEEHTHTAECGLICGISKEHTHSNECCSLENHIHSKSCYADVGSEAWSSEIGKHSNPEQGQIFGGRLGNYIYIGGTWYDYNGKLSSGTIATTTCGKTAHTHGTNCNYICGDTEHTHTDACYNCGKEAHIHAEADVTGGIPTCGLDTTKKLMGSLHPGEALWVYEKSDTVTVNADGTSVLDVYFTRKEFTLRFRKANSSKDDYGTITARWGANIEKQYEAVIAEAGDSFWSENADASSPWTNYIGIMPKRDIIYYLKSDSSRDTSTMKYYGKDLNGDYQLIFSVTFHGTNYTITDKDKYEFKGYTYERDNKSNGQNCNGAEFYYNRNSYKLDFYSASKNNADKEVSVLYEASLKPYNYTPTSKPDTVEADAIFVGWYLNPECTGERFYVDDHTMPSHNIALYAKWVNGLYTVKTYTDDSLNTLYTYDGYSGVQENIEKYSTATAPTEPTKTGGYSFVGWFYKDDNGEEKPFSFTMNIVRDYDLYPKFTKLENVTLTVHYYLENTTEKLADDSELIVPVNENYTIKAKMGTELNLVDADTVNDYYPYLTSTSVKVTGEGQEYIFYYKKAGKVNYTVKYVDKNTGSELLTSVTKETDYITVTEYYQPIDGYAPLQYSITKDLSADADKNILIFYYEEIEQTVNIGYVAVGPEGATNFGSVSPTTETVKVNSGTAQGSTATAGNGYKFVGWYKDAACTQPVDTAWVTGNKIVPQKTDGKNVATTYYAKFEYDVADLTITKSGCSDADENQAFIFTVTGPDDFSMKVVIKGNGSVTIKGLKIGEYTIHEENSWSWRYECKDKTVTLQPGENEVTMTNSRENTGWLDGNAYNQNIFNGKNGNN